MTVGARLTPLVAGVLWAACAPSGPPTPPPATDGFLVSGCSDWDAQGVCHAEGPLTVWVESSTAAHPRVEAAGYTTSEPTRALGGHRFTLTPTATTGPTLDTVVRVEGIPRLGLQRRAARPKLDPKLLEGKTADDLALLLPTLSPSARLELLAAAHSRIAPVAGPVRDRLLRQGILLAEGLERRQQRTVFRFVAAQSRLQQGDLAGSEAELKAGQQADARDGLPQGWMAYAQAQLARQRGDAARALSLFIDVRSIGERLNDEYPMWVADQLALPLLRQSGFVDRAKNVEAAVIAHVDALDCRSRGPALTNVGWSRLMAREVVLRQHAALFVIQPPDSTTAILAEAQRAQEECGGSTYNGALNLLLDAVQRADVEQALYWQGRAHELPQIPALTAWDLLLGARLKVLEGVPAEAEAIFSGIADQPGIEPMVRVEALLGVVLARELGNDLGGAVTALQKAAVALSNLPHGPTGLADAEANSSLAMLWARLAVELYGRSGQPEQAFQAALRAQQMLASESEVVAFRDSDTNAQSDRDARLQRFYVHRASAAKKRGVLWASSGAEHQALAREVDEEERLAAAALNEALGRSDSQTYQGERPPSGGAQIVLHPGIDRWWSLLRDDRQSTATFVPTSSSSLDRITAELLAALPQDLRSYHELQMIPAGALRDVDVHATTYRGRPLALLLPVSYGMTRVGQKRAHAEGVALLLGDDRAHQLSQEELTVVRELLERRAVKTRAPRPGTLDAPTLQGLLADAQVLHFAGHAERSETALRTGLRLRDDLWLTAADVLASPRVPATVVLSGCDTSRHMQRDVGWSVSDAFLLAGAQEVVGTARPVDGELAQAMMRGFYQGATSATTRLFLAAVELSKSSPEADWAAFRVTVPVGRFSLDAPQRTGSSDATVTGAPAPD